MSTIKLEVDYRSDMSKSRVTQLRKNKCATGSVFGHDTAPVAIEVKLDELIDQIKKTDTGMTSLIDMKINGAPENVDGVVIIKEFTKDHLSRKVLDVQFQRVFMKEKMRINVPVIISGTAAGIKDGGTIDQVTNEILIESLPGQIPASIEVDITNLESGHHISVADLAPNANYDILTEQDTVLVACVASRVRTVEETPEAG